MKFKTIFALFNAVLAFSFIFIFLMPFLLLGTAYSLDFWKTNWPLGLFFLAVLAAFNVFFLSNWRTFSLVEKEDWRGLMLWLQSSQFAKGRYQRRSVRMYVNAALLCADQQAIALLEQELSERKPKALERDALLFSVARSLGEDTAAALAFMDRYADSRAVDNADWLAFYRAFGLVRANRAQESAGIVRRLLESNDAVLRLLSAYLAVHSCAPAMAPSDRANLLALANAVRVR
ncbi:MAG TPA: hypothetical protein PLC54_07105, partial [Spirochaetales bacterium]|nr:hypothetical protein [Spirochaetales bacterium]